MSKWLYKEYHLPSLRSTYGKLPPLSLAHAHFFESVQLPRQLHPVELFGIMTLGSIIKDLMYVKPDVGETGESSTRLVAGIPLNSSPPEMSSHTKPSISEVLVGMRPATKLT
jgi:hypothetical protein